MDKPQNTGSIFDLPASSEDGRLFDFIDFKKLLSDVVHYWWLFVISVIVALFAANLYNKYTKPIYATEASLIISADTKKTYDMTAGVTLGQTYTNFDNQLGILNSRALISNVIKKMGINVSYYHIGNIKNTEMFPCNELILIMDSTHAQPINTNIYITPIDDNSFSLSIKGEKIQLYNFSTEEHADIVEKISYEGSFFYGEPIITSWCAFSIVSPSKTRSEYYVRLTPNESLVSTFTSSLKVLGDAVGSSTIVKLSVNGTNQNKNKLFLNTLMQYYIDDNLNQKNRVSENTIRFIEKQLMGIQDTLHRIGSELSRFRVVNGIQNNISEKGAKLSDEIKVYEKEKKGYDVVMEYYNYLTNYFKNDTVLSGVIAPATFSTNNTPIITEQLNKILSLNTEKQKLTQLGGSEGNPAYNNIMVRLHIARNTLLSSLESQRVQTQEKIDEIDKKLSSYYSQLMGLPEAERQLLGIDRMYTLNTDVYNFLMRKLSEAQIQKASNVADHQMLDEARTVAIVSPNKKQNQLYAVVAALVLPLILILLRQVIDSKVRTQYDVTKETKKSILGEIPNSSAEENQIVLKRPRSYVAEEFRRLRIRLDFITQGKEKIILAVSSSMPSDGKTFTALNLASVYAIAGKRTVLLGFDLRKPGLNKIFDINKKQGISDYLIGNCALQDIITHTESLDVVGSGTIPPNPSELILSSECSDMMKLMQEQYDVIIIDTPPLGLVTDALQIAKWADALLFVVRQDYTEKDAMKYSLGMLKDNGIENVNIIINDINSKKSRYGYGYGYGGSYGKYGRYGYGKYGYGKKYGYGYGYGYGESEEDDK